MRKLVPFKKDIVFDTNIDEINSISLEHEVKIKKDSFISGKFIVGGDYKMTSNSLNLDDFNYELPVNINIDKKYDIAGADVDINDFYYEVVNNKILSVNIELAIDKIEEKKEEEIKEEEVIETMDRCVEVEDEAIDNMDKQEVLLTDINENMDNNFTNLFDNINDNESYTTYKVHIVRENDTIDSIMMDYQVTKEQLGDYNNLSDVKIGDKLIVPANEN